MFRHNSLLAIHHFPIPPSHMSDSSNAQESWPGTSRSISVTCPKGRPESRSLARLAGAGRHGRLGPPAPQEPSQGSAAAGAARRSGARGGLGGGRSGGDIQVLQPLPTSVILCHGFFLILILCTQLSFPTSSDASLERIGQVQYFRPLVDSWGCRISPL